MRFHFFSVNLFPRHPCKGPFTFECQFHARTAAIFWRRHIQVCCLLCLCYNVERLRLQPMRCALIFMLPISSPGTCARAHSPLNAGFMLQRPHFWRRHIQAYIQYRPMQYCRAFALATNALRPCFSTVNLLPNHPCKGPFSFECQFHATTASFLAQA